MARSNAYEEVMRIVLQTSGEEGVAALQRALEGMGEGGEEAERQISGLFDELAKARGLEKTATSFRELGTEVLSAGQRYRDLQAQTEAAALQLAETEEPTKRQQRQFAQLTGELEKAGRELEKSRGAWRQQRDALEASGIATARYGDLQAQVAAKQAQATKQIGDFADQQTKAAAASRANADRLEEADEKFRKQAAASRSARDALDAYRDRADAAADATKELEQSAGSSLGVLDKLKTIAAGVLGFVSFRALWDQLKGVVAEGSNAEQELGQLEAVLASTGREAEFTTDKLAAMVEQLDRGRFDHGEITRGMTELLSYTNIIGDEFPAAMQIVIDQAERLGIGIEQSATRIGTALQTPSKAMATLGRQGFVLEESQKSLIQRLEATGQTAEAQRIIIDLLNESYAGAAEAARLGKIQGLWKSITETYKDFQTQIAEAGVLDYFKGQMRELLEISGRMASDGTLAQYARNTAAAIVSVAESVKSATVFLYEHRGGLVMLAKAYAALKIGQAVIAMNAWRIAQIAAARAALTHASALDTTAGAATRLGRVMRAIPTSIKIGVALIGADLAVKGARELGEWLGKNSEAAQHAAQFSERVREQLRQEALARAELAAGLAKYSDQAVLSADQVAQLSEAERVAYEGRLKGLQDYLKAQLGFLLRQKELGVATDEQLTQLSVMPARLAAVRNGFAAVAEGAALAGKALQQGVGPAAAKISEQLREVQGDARLSQQKLSELFQNLKFEDATAVGDLAAGIAKVAEESEGAALGLRTGLVQELRKLTAEELAQFQAGGQAAFEEFQMGAEGTAAVLDASLYTAMERLGVSADRVGLGFSLMGQEAVKNFGTVLENANATAAQIETAFKAALTRAATPEEAEQLGILLRSAGEQGKIGFDAAERSAAALRARVEEIKGAVDPLTDEFARLGITSKAALDRTRDAARDSFHAIRQAFGRGEAAIEDVRAAVRRYAEAMRAAAADSDASARKRVEDEIRVMQAIFGTQEALAGMGDAGEVAGDRTAAGADRAAEAIRRMQLLAGGAGGDLQNMGDSADDAGDKVDKLEQASKRAGAALGEMSAAAVQALMSQNRYVASPRIWVMSMNRVLAAIAEEKNAVDELTQSYEAQTAALDPQMQQLNQLRQTYQYATDEQLRALAASKAAFEERKKQILEERRAKRDARRDAARDAQGGSASATSAASGTRSLGRLEIVMPEGETRDLLTDAAGAELVTEMLDQLARSRGVSQLRRRG